AQWDSTASKPSFTLLQNLEEVTLEAMQRYEGFRIPKYLKLRDGVYHAYTAPILTKAVSNYEYMTLQHDRDRESVEIWEEMIPTLLGSLSGEGASRQEFRSSVESDAKPLLDMLEKHTSPEARE